MAAEAISVHPWEGLTTEVTEAYVTWLYQVKAAIWVAAPEEMNVIVANLGLRVDSLDKKTVFNALCQKSFPISRDKLDHHNRLNYLLARVQEVFASVGSQVALINFGSFATGVINGVHTDLDMIGVLPQDPSELEIFGRLAEVGIVVSNELGPINDLQVLAKTGYGLARLYALSREGIEVEFHIIGSHDAAMLPKFNPGFIRRVRPILTKVEHLSSFNGKSLQRKKESDIVRHYVYQRGSLYKGFFVDALLLGIPVTDKAGIGQDLISQLWISATKAFLYHNGAYVRDGQQRVIGIDLNKAPFDSFVASCITTRQPTFTPERYALFADRFKSAISIVIDRYKLQVV